MSLIGLLDYIRGMFGQGSPEVAEWRLLTTEYETTHLKQTALDTVVGKIKNACQLVVFDSEDPLLNYVINVRPNDNQNAMEFRNVLLDRLLLDGEALIVTINNQWYVADSFAVDESVLKPKKYKNVIVDNLELFKEFYASEVYHLKYNNDKLRWFLERLDESYAKLFSRLIDVHMREQQLRVYAKFGTNRPLDKENKEKFERYLHGLKKQLSDESVVVAPRQDNYEIEERSQQYLGRSVTEVGEVENLYVKQVANILQVPPLIFSGDLADVSEHNNNFVRWCVRPLMNLLVTEINAKYFSKAEYRKGQRLKMNTVHVIYNSEFEMASSIEKMIGSGAWTIDDTLELRGRQRLHTPITTQRYLTKNIAPLNEDGTVKEG